MLIYRYHRLAIDGVVCVLCSSYAEAKIATRTLKIARNDGSILNLRQCTRAARSLPRFPSYPLTYPPSRPLALSPSHPLTLSLVHPLFPVTSLVRELSSDIVRDEEARTDEREAEREALCLSLSFSLSVYMYICIYIYIYI